MSVLATSERRCLTSPSSSFVNVTPMMWCSRSLSWRGLRTPRDMERSWATLSCMILSKTEQAEWSFIMAEDMLSAEVGGASSVSMGGRPMTYLGEEGIEGS